MKNLVPDISNKIKSNKKIRDVHRKTLIVLDVLSDKFFGATIENGVNRNRRRVLTACILGGGALVATKVLSSVMDMFTGDTVLSEKMFENFIVKETGQSLSFFDRQSGEPILIIDK